MHCCVQARTAGECGPCVSIQRGEKTRSRDSRLAIGGTWRSFLHNSLRQLFVVLSACVSCRMWLWASQQWHFLIFNGYFCGLVIDVKTLGCFFFHINTGELHDYMFLHENKAPCFHEETWNQSVLNKLWINQNWRDRWRIEYCPVNNLRFPLLPFFLVELAKTSGEMQQKASVRLTWFPDSHVPNYLDNHAAQDNDERTLNGTDMRVSVRCYVL